MSPTPRVLIQKQVQRVRRRLLWQKLLETLVLYWAAGLGVCAVWFVARPFLGVAAGGWAQWGIPAGVLAGSTLAAVLWSILRAPQFVEASLALDREFDLQERVTTFSLLTVEQADSPAGHALLEDVRHRVETLDVPGRFPISLRWKKGLMPVCAGLLAFAASFFNPSFSTANNNNGKRLDTTVNPKEIQEQLENLRKVTSKKFDEELKSEKLKELEQEWDKLLQKPLDPNNKDQVRERTQDMRNLEEKIKERIQDLKDKTELGKDLKKALEKLALDKLGKKLQDGPAKDLEDALAKGKFDKAQDILEKLQKQLEENKLNKEEMNKLAEQFKELQDKLKRLADQKDKKDQLKKDFEDGKINKEELAREMEKLEQEAEEMKGLEELADLFGECKDCMGAGNNLKAGKLMKAALDKLKEIELSEDELRRLIRDAELLEAARMQMLAACQGDPNMLKNGMGEGKQPGGVRPVGDEPDSKIVDGRQKGEVDPLGQQKITGFSRGGTFKKIPAKEVGGAFKQAVQEAPEAIERQRIPTEAEAQVRGYFRKLGGQKD
ncbi:MAG: hypothetical protein L0215_16340 [Gemmataceae bacterium]|nr:hypothetical protein [Gemmataceae bacterium]